MSETANDTVRCMVLPLDGSGLLVPSAAVAEIVVVPEVAPLENAPPWLEGLLSWRGVRVPLFAAESALGGDRAALTSRGRVAILHVLDDSAAVRFYGIGIQRLPTVVAADEASTTAIPMPDAPDWVSGCLRLESGDAWVPDFEVLERQLFGALAEQA